jgi:hypothetical protein
MSYYGKYSLSKKAVDIELLKIEPIIGEVSSLTTETVQSYSGNNLQYNDTNES